MNELIEKYKKIGFINDDDEDKEKLALSFEDSIKWLISIEETDTYDVSTLFIPLIKILYKNESFDYKEEYIKLKNWMDSEGEIWKKDVNNINDVDLFQLYINNKN